MKTQNDSGGTLERRGGGEKRKALEKVFEKQVFEKRVDQQESKITGRL
jgi:hypothetical protein